MEEQGSRELKFSENWGLCLFIWWASVHIPWSEPQNYSFWKGPQEVSSSASRVAWTGFSELYLFRSWKPPGWRLSVWASFYNDCLPEEKGLFIQSEISFFQLRPFVCCPFTMHRYEKPGYTFLMMLCRTWHGCEVPPKPSLSLPEQDLFPQSLTMGQPFQMQIMLVAAAELPEISQCPSCIEGP